MRSEPLPKAMLLDLGNTVLRQSRLDMAAAMNWLMESIEEPHATKLREDLSKLYLEIRHSLRHGVTEFPIRCFLKLAFDLAGRTPTASLVELELQFWQHICTMEPLPGIEAVLRELHARGIRIGLVSNSVFGQETLRYELERNHLLHWFEVTVSSADYGLQKPHPMIFRAALKQIGCEAHETWFAGDNFENDIIGSTALGMRAFFLTAPERTQPIPDRSTRFSSWHEFLPLLQEPA